MPYLLLPRFLESLLSGDSLERLELGLSGVTDLLCLLLVGRGGDALGVLFFRARLSSSERLRCGGGEDSDSSLCLGFLAAAGDTSALDLRLTGSGDGDALDDLSLLCGGETDSLADFLLLEAGGESLASRFLADGGEALG